MDDETQRSILEKLMEYGDSLLAEDSQIPHSTSKRRIIEHHLSNTRDDAVQKKKMKMKKKKKKTATSVKASNEKDGKEKKNSLKDFEEELKLFQATQKEKSSEEEEITVLDRRKEDDGQRKKKRKAPEVIIFDDPTKRKKKSHAKPESRPGSKGVKLTEGEVDLDQARHEVWKFGISGLSFDDKEKQEAAKAVQLGAKPPKREFVNYKELMETNRQKKIEERQQREIDRQMGLKTSKKKEGKIQLQNKGFWTDKTQRKGVYVDGQLGKYKRGVQVFSKRELAKIKNQKGKGKR